MTLAEKRSLSRCRVEPNLCVVWTGPRNNLGYGKVAQGDGTGRFVHRVAWARYHGPIPEDMCVLHRCDNPPCFNLDHLFLGTRRENLEDMTRKGRRSHGEGHGTAKLTDAIMREILRSSASNMSFARRLGVSSSVIDDIKNRRTWRHVQPGDLEVSDDA